MRWPKLQKILPQSLRWRLLLALLGVLLLALVLTGLTLQRLFNQHISEQFRQDLLVQLDQLTAKIELDENGQASIEPQSMSDPRWTRTYSGLYWQIDQISANGQTTTGVLRSRSLWDYTLNITPDKPAPTLGSRRNNTSNTIQRLRATGPQGAPLIVLARTIQTDESNGAQWRLMVASETSHLQAAFGHFAGLLAISLCVLFVLLVAAGWLQVQIGLAPLQPLQKALQQLRTGEVQRLDGHFPLEVQPLVNDFNTVLANNAAIVQRARTQAGNLAHAIKTPLAVLQQAAYQASPQTASHTNVQANAQATDPLSQLPQLVAEQVALARRHVDWHMARSRAAAAAGMPGQRTELAPALNALIRAMRHIHADKHLNLQLHLDPPHIAFAGETQDLHELLGNLLDNACKWARSQVTVQATMPTTTQATVPATTQVTANTQETRAPHETQRLLHITIDDDGPGITPAQRPQAMQRGMRLDETVAGAGLGLAIASELTSLYNGTISLQESPAGGLRVLLNLPAADVPQDTSKPPQPQ